MTAALTSVGVQQVSIAIANGALTGTVALSTVGSGAFILQQGETTTDSTTAVSASARIEITSTILTTATRNTASTDTVTMNATIVDGDTTNLINSVQSGTIAISGASTSGTASASAVTNANAVVINLGQSTASTANYLRYPANCSFAGTTVTMARNTASGAVTGGWCLPEYKAGALNSSTQNVTVTTAASGTSFSTAISSVTTGNSFLAYGGWNTGANTADARKDFLRLSIASATAVHGDCNTAPAVTTGIAKGVVGEFVSGILAQSIQRGTIAISASTSGTLLITSSPTAQTATNWLGNSSEQSVFTLASSIARSTQTNATTLTMNVNTAASPTGSVEAINFNPAGGGTTFNDTLTESLTATDSETGLATDAASLSETGTATTSQTGAATDTGSLTETGTTSDSYIGGKATSDTLSETSNASDTEAALSTGRANLSETGTSSNLVNGAATASGSMIETIISGDQFAGTANDNDALTETDSASDTYALQNNVYNDFLIETVAANDNYADANPTLITATSAGSGDDRRRKYLEWLKKRKTRERIRQAKYLKPEKARELLSITKPEIIAPGIEQKINQTLTQESIGGIAREVARQYLIAIYMEMELAETARQQNIAQEDDELFLMMM